MDDSNGEWPKWVNGIMNIVGGTLQAALGAAIGAAAGWTGVGAVAASVLVANGAATATQGVGQIVNSITQSNTMREDNFIRTGVQCVGRSIGGDTGAAIAGMAYDVGIMAAAAYAPYAAAPVPQSTSPLYTLNGAKGVDYVNKRGWTDDMINEAICFGNRGSSVNMANGASCTAYLYPGTQNQYVVIENYTRNLVQLSKFTDTGWIVDPRIVWYP